MMIERLLSNYYGMLFTSDQTQITGCRLRGLSPDPSRPIEFVEAGKPVKFICQITDSDKMTNIVTTEIRTIIAVSIN